jgi:S-adenosylmethionine hydrolase
VAAHLARGEALEGAGEVIPGDSLVALEQTRPAIEPGRVVAHVVSVDRYGNTALDLSDRDLPDTGLRLGRGLAVETRDGGRDAVFALARVKQDLLARLEAFGLASKIGPELLFPTLPTAVQAYQDRTKDPETRNQRP